MDACRSLENVEVIAICDIMKEKARSLAKK